MKIVFKEINIVIVANKPLDFDSFIRSEIKEALNDNYDEPPKYLEIPERAAVFDYLTNPDFPVQLNLQDDKIVFVLNGNTSFDIDNEVNLQKFTNCFSDILKLSSFKGIIPEVKAIGLNVSMSVISEDGETVFSETMNNLQSVLSQEGAFHAGGIQILRTDDNKRLEVMLNPVIPEMGQEFTHSYNIRINQHFQPAEDKWLESLNDNVLAFKMKASEIISNLK